MLVLLVRSELEKPENMKFLFRYHCPTTNNRRRVIQFSFDESRFSKCLYLTTRFLESWKFFIEIFVRLYVVDFIIKHVQEKYRKDNSYKSGIQLQYFIKTSVYHWHRYLSLGIFAVAMNAPFSALCWCESISVTYEMQTFQKKLLYRIEYLRFL